MKQVERATTGTGLQFPAWPSTKAVWLLLYVAYNALDILTTKIGLAAGIPEGNPLPAWVLARWGEVAMYGVKIGIMGAGLLLVLAFGQRRPRLWGMVYATVAILALVVTSNVNLISA